LIDPPDVLPADAGMSHLENGIILYG